MTRGTVATGGEVFSYRRARQGAVTRMTGGTGIMGHRISAGQRWWITMATGAICSGPIIEAGAIQACSAKTTFTLEDGVEVIGDVLTFESDGTVWAIQGNFQAGNSITIA